MLQSMRRRRISLAQAAYNRGSEEGYTHGWRDGHWLGRCEAVIRMASPVPMKRFIHVLYITSGKGYPYSPLDYGIVESLKLIAERVTIALPSEDVETIASKEGPDLMLVLEGMEMPIAKVQAVGKLGVRTAIWLTDDPYYTDITSKLVPYYDCVFTLERNCISFYKEKGCSRVYYLPLGVYPLSYRPQNTSITLRGDICFIGTAYWNRVSLFNQIIPRLAHRRVLISGIWWDRLAEYERWKSLIELGRWMEPSQTSELYNANKITINNHRAYDDESYNQNSAQIAAVSPNPRTFEISASGSLQLTDAREDLVRFYVPGYDIVTYDSPDDLVYKTEYYLEHEEERQTIALRGLYRTMRDHTYISRLNQLLDLAMSPPEQEEEEGRGTALR